jgi:hypothetical protein
LEHEDYPAGMDALSQHFIEERLREGRVNKKLSGSEIDV